MWILLDLAVAYLSAVISIGPSDHTAAITAGPPLERAAAVVWFLAIAGRRFAPATALWAASAATVAVALADLPVTNATLATAMALTLVLRSRPTRLAAECAAVPVLASMAVLSTQPDAFVPALLAQAVAIVIGRAGRTRWESQEALRIREIEHQRQAAIAAERTRMARELHDAVGHAVTVMVAHAGAARFALADGDDAVKKSFGDIERVGREAMRDLDGILGLLAPEDDPAGDVDLEESLRALVSSMPPGLGARLHLNQGSLQHLAPQMADVVHRVVQESLTNVIRHAHSTNTVVDVTVEDGTWIRVEIQDNGTAGTTSPQSRGRGLAGMRERVLNAGGDWESGPAAAGGWVNRARLPTAATAPVEEAA